MPTKSLSAILFVFVFSLACGGAREEAPAPAAEAPAIEEAADITNPGTVTGKISYEGAEPKSNRMRMDVDAACAKQHAGGVLLLQEVKVQNGALRDVFVWVKEGLGNRKFPTPKEQAVLDQKGCVYAPHVFGVQTGQEIKILNSDPTTHNIHPIPQNNREWNQSQSPNVQPLVKSFPRQEIMVPVKCNIHPWMKSYIGVVDHPYFAVSSDDGSFEIKNLPPGDYTIEAWHEKLGPMQQKVTVGPNETKEVSFSFKG